MVASGSSSALFIRSGGKRAEKDSQVSPMSRFSARFSPTLPTQAYLKRPGLDLITTLL